MVDCIVKNGHIDPKTSKIIQHSEIHFCTFSQIQMVNYQAIKKTKTFCINQKVTLGADFGACFLYKRNSSFMPANH